MIRKCCKNDGPFPKQETAPPFFYILVCPFNNIIHMLFSFKADPLLIQSKDFTIFHYDLSVDDRIGHIMSVCSIYDGIYQILAWSDMRLINI
jgi:hypothetical protein